MEKKEEELKKLLPKLSISEIRHVLEHLNSVNIDKIDFYSCGSDATFDIVQGFLWQNYGIKIPDISDKNPYLKGAEHTKIQENIWKNKFSAIFGNCRIVALVGKRNTGKTNNLISLLTELRERNKEIKIKVYGFNPELKNYLENELKTQTVCSLKQIKNSKDCLLVCDEFQRLKINDRRYKAELTDFTDNIYHNNVYVILSSPNIREFNSVIGGHIEKWLVKSVDLDQCINGSQLKKAIEDYSGAYKVGKDIKIEDKSTLLVVDDENNEIILDCPYMKKADTKLKNTKLF